MLADAAAPGSWTGPFLQEIPFHLQLADLLVKPGHEGFSAFWRLSWLPPKMLAAPPSKAFFQAWIWLGWTSYRAANLAIVSSPFTASNATLALNAAPCFLRPCDTSRSSFTTDLILGAGLSLSYLSSFPGPPHFSVAGVGIAIRFVPENGSGEPGLALVSTPTPISVLVATPMPPSTPTGDVISIAMASSITKWEWLDAAVQAFNTASTSDPNLQVNGKPIQVEVLLEEDPLSGRLRHWNSPTQVAATLRGEIKPTILSPAATTWILKLNKEWQALYGIEITSDLEPPSLLSTPVVIAMWESRARALGCWPVPEPDCTWKRIRDLAASPDGWGMVGHPEWGMFHFGYAYVGESDVGTQTAVLLCMMGIQKTADLTVGDVEATNGCGQAIADVEKVIVHRGTSSPLILEAMRSGGPEYLDAVTTYEKNVIGFNRANQDNLRELLVAVYPQDGTVIADHTFAIMDRAPWVAEEQVKAAEMFREFLFTTEQQELLLGYGLRPAESTVRLGPPIDAASGANPAANLAPLEVPDVLVVDRIVEVWQDVKKPANIVLVFDKSGSMRGGKIAQALNGAVEFVDAMDRKDWLFWLPFDDQFYPGTQGYKGEVGEQLQIDIRSTTARGGTALYDTIAHAYQVLEERRERQGDSVRYGIVVLSDGKDESSDRTTLAVLEEMLRPTESDQAGIQVHTIGIGDDAEDQVLTKIASFTHGGRYWKVKDPATIEAVYRRISKYW